MPSLYTIIVIYKSEVSERIMRIISWNVNSIRARMVGFLRAVKEYEPDVLLLQETRVEDAQFPYEYIEDCGYNIAVKGQKSRNGVAICSKHIIIK